ncbi:MAG: mucoidy inhibitor MuiA family protein [Gemmataceae bacterium]|nr:mucoidy inhibitor MuiA family protein [Gemmataceae bacterium]
MWKRVIPWLTACTLATVLVFVAQHMPANPSAAQGQPPAATPADRPAAPAAPMAAVKAATSRVTAVTVYPNSALVTREVDVPEGNGVLELTVTPLPPTTVNSSLYTEGAEGIRVLTTRFRTRPILEDTREDVRKLQDELKKLQLSREKLEADSKAVQANARALDKLETFNVQGTEKGALNSDSAIALSKHIRESRLETARELVGLQQQIQAIQEKSEFTQRKLNELATVTTRTERDAVIVVEKNNGGPGKVRLNYLVDAAAWRPQYKLRASKKAGDPVRLEYLAAVVQHTGEEWSNAQLVLSTARPLLNAAPPELQTLVVTAAPQGKGPVAHRPDLMELEDQIKVLRGKAEQNFNAKKQASGIGLYNTAAALDQSWELLNPDAAVKRGCALAVREGPTVTYPLNTRLSVPSRNDEQVLEIARIDLQPQYYYKAVPILTSHVYRLADLTNKSNHVLLPGEATMYIGTDFVGQMDLPLVAIGEQFTAGFGIDPQLQVQRQMIDRARTTQGANQALRYEYRILVSSYKSEKVKLQVWDRLPHAETEAVGVSLLKSAPDLSKDALYLREQRPTNLLRWDVQVDPSHSGEKALAIRYEFKLELDRQMTISNFKTAGVFGAPSATPTAAATAPMTSAERGTIQAAMAKLSPEDRRLAEAQLFCAIDQGSLLGSMGPVLKVMVKGQPVFLCCRGCEAEARAHPDETLAQFRKLMARRAPK